MDLLISVTFIEFRRLVETAIREKPGYTIENYQVDVGNNVLAFASAYVERYNERRMDWPGWLGSQDFGEATEFFKDVKRATTTNTKNAEAASKWAFAFHFRLHGHFDGLEKYAWAIDELVFGERLDKRGKSVFVEGSKKLGDPVNTENASYTSKPFTMARDFTEIVSREISEAHVLVYSVGTEVSRDAFQIFEEIKAASRFAEMVDQDSSLGQLTGVLSSEHTHLVVVFSDEFKEGVSFKSVWLSAKMKGISIGIVDVRHNSELGPISRWLTKDPIFRYHNSEEKYRLLNILANYRRGGERQWLTKSYSDGLFIRNFVKRPVVYDKIKSVLLSYDQNRHVTLCTALEGAGGFGKTALASELCRDLDMRCRYSDGIFWVQMDSSSTMDHAISLAYGLASRIDQTLGELPRLGLVDARDQINRALLNKYVLIVIDDVWQKSLLEPFKVTAAGCSIVVTSRRRELNLPNSTSILVDLMAPDEAYEVLTFEFPKLHKEVVIELNYIAEELGYWAQLLDLANGWFRTRLNNRMAIRSVISEFRMRVGEYGIVAFDSVDDAPSRDAAIRAVINLSLEDLSATNRQLYALLGIFPEDRDLPLDAIQRIWLLDTGTMHDLVQVLLNFQERSLIADLDLIRRTIRLHDNMHSFLRSELLNAGMIDKLQHAFALSFKGNCPEQTGKTTDFLNYCFNGEVFHIDSSSDISVSHSTLKILVESYLEVMRCKYCYLDQLKADLSKD